MAQADSEKAYDVSADQYFKSICAYEKYPEFIDGMKSVKVERNGNTVVGHYELSMMGKEMNYSLTVTEKPETHSMNWTLLKSDFFKLNNGSWQIESTGPKSCKVKYMAEVDFNFMVPGFILKGIIKSTLPSMMNHFYERAKKL